MSWKKYERMRQFAEMRPYIPGEMLGQAISISDFDLRHGSPKLGDMIARNPRNYQDQWLVSQEYFEENFLR